MSSEPNMFKSKRSAPSEGPIEGRTDDDFVARRSVPRSDYTREETAGGTTPLGAPLPDIVTEEPMEELGRAASHTSLRSKGSSADRAGGGGSTAPVASRQPSQGSYAEQHDTMDGGAPDAAEHRSQASAGMSDMQQPGPMGADLQLENQKLRAQIESLQRLYTSGSQETKVHRIQEEVTVKAKRIKELEAKVKKLSQENQFLKENVKKLRSRKDHDGLSQHDSKSSLSKQVLSQNERIHELEFELHHAEHTIDELRHAIDHGHPAPPIRNISLTSDGPAPPAASAKDGGRRSRRGSKSSRSGSPAASETHRLRDQVGDKDRTIQDLQARLARAQEAILSSAGVGWEAHVKLHQTRGVLQKIARSPSPARSAASLSLPPSRPVGWVPEAYQSAGRSFHGVEIKAAEDAQGRLRLWRVAGTPGVVTRMHYAAGVIRDQNGEAIRTATEAYADEIPRLAALADACGVSHNLPQSPCVVVAGHSVSSPQSHVSSYRGHSPQIRY
ncbi:hypothetical protein DIPPA_00695 [Diplonema papillatum]|nr:hypothetical protein DIPPA_00695 [Diplonema papillatum]